MEGFAQQLREVIGDLTGLLVDLREAILDRVHRVAGARPSLSLPHGVSYPEAYGRHLNGIPLSRGARRTRLAGGSARACGCQ